MTVFWHILGWTLTHLVLASLPPKSRRQPCALAILDHCLAFDFPEVGCIELTTVGSCCLSISVFLLDAVDLSRGWFIVNVTGLACFLSDEFFNGRRHTGQVDSFLSRISMKERWKSVSTRSNITLSFSLPNILHTARSKLSYLKRENHILQSFNTEVQVCITFC
jgi:hypothetical protein